MPAFAAKAPIFISPSDNVALVDSAATDSGITYTQAVVIAQSSGPSIGPQLTLQNTTNQAATVYVSARDTPTTVAPNGSTANYSALTNGDSGVACTVAAGSTINFTTGGPFICAHFGTSPTSGSLIIAR